jgi:hypothetical protein
VLGDGFGGTLEQVVDESIIALSLERDETFIPLLQFVKSCRETSRLILEAAEVPGQDSDSTGQIK